MFRILRSTILVVPLVLSVYGTPIGTNVIAKTNDPGQEIHEQDWTSADPGLQITQNKIDVKDNDTETPFQFQNTTEMNIDREEQKLRQIHTQFKIQVQHPKDMGNTDQKKPILSLQIPNLTKVNVTDKGKPKLGQPIQDDNKEEPKRDPIIQKTTKLVDSKPNEAMSGLQIANTAEGIDTDTTEPKLGLRIQNSIEMVEADPKEPEIQNMPEVLDIDMEEPKVDVDIQDELIETALIKPKLRLQVENLAEVMGIGMEEPKLEIRCFGGKGGSPRRRRRRSPPRPRVVSPPSHRAKPNLGLEMTIDT